MELLLLQSAKIYLYTSALQVRLLWIICRSLFDPQFSFILNPLRCLALKPSSKPTNLVAWITEPTTASWYITIEITSYEDIHPRTLFFLMTYEVQFEILMKALWSCDDHPGLQHDGLWNCSYYNLQKYTYTRPLY